MKGLPDALSVRGAPHRRVRRERQVSFIENRQILTGMYRVLLSEQPRLCLRLSTHSLMCSVGIYLPSEEPIL